MELLKCGLEKHSAVKKSEGFPNCGVYEISECTVCERKLNSRLTKSERY